MNKKVSGVDSTFVVTFFVIIEGRYNFYQQL